MKRRDFLGSSACLGLAASATPLWAFQPVEVASDWEIGPLIRGRNYSVNLPPSPTQSREGWFFDFPGPRRENGHVHYLTKRTGSLAGARGIRLRYRIDTRSGARFIPQERPDQSATLSLYLQQRGDNWRAKGRTKFARWYSPHARLVEISSGEQEVEISFDENWIAVVGSDRERSPREFARALANASRIGFVFGSPSLRGHGVFATRPARFTLLEFAVLR